MSHLPASPEVSKAFLCVRKSVFLGDCPSVCKSVLLQYPRPLFLYAFGELYDLLNSFRMSNNRSSCSVLYIFSTKYIVVFFTFQYIIVRVRYRVWCERNKRSQRVVCNNTINALFVSLFYLNVFDIFRFKVFHWVYESYFLKKKKEKKKETLSSKQRYTFTYKLRHFARNKNACNAGIAYIIGISSRVIRCP